MGMSIEKRQGRIQFEYRGHIAFGYFPATKAQEKSVWLGDRFAHFECEDEGVRDNLLATWKTYRYEHWEEMKGKAWRPVNFGNFVKNYVQNTLKAKVISFRDCDYAYDPRKVY